MNTNENATLTYIENDSSRDKIVFKENSPLSKMIENMVSDKHVAVTESRSLRMYVDRMNDFDYFSDLVVNEFMRSQTTYFCQSTNYIGAMLKYYLVEEVCPRDTIMNEINSAIKRFNYIDYLGPQGAAALSREAIDSIHYIFFDLFETEYKKYGINLNYLRIESLAQMVQALIKENSHV